MAGTMDFQDDDLANLPEGIVISTMSATCQLGTTVDIKVVDKLIRLSDDAVLSIKFGDKSRSLEVEKRRAEVLFNIDAALAAVKLEEGGFFSQFENHNHAITNLINAAKSSITDVGKKSKKKKKTKKMTSFFNQITMEIRTVAIKKVNVKLFCNGSIQMTGCKTVTDCNIAIQKLIAILRGIGKVEKVVSDEENMRMHNFKIDMINSNFKINYKINRRQLHNIVGKQPGIYSRYEPNIHACVNIKYFGDGDNRKGISIFAFESGNIIITGAKNRNHIMTAHKFITDFLDSHDVKKIDIEKFMVKT